jgi:hypothetical protein
MSSAPAPYAIAPDYAGKFKPSQGKEILAAVLSEKLTGKEFSADLTTQWTKEIADEVKTRLKGERAMLGAVQRGGGPRAGGRRRLSRMRRAWDRAARVPLQALKKKEEAVELHAFVMRGLITDVRD